MPSNENAQTNRKSRRLPRKATPKSLENAALHYLQRYASSAENLRRVLLRRVERSARAHGTDRAEGAGFVEAIVERFLRSGLLDDRTYAEAQVMSLRRRGASERAIRANLRAKGVAAEDIDHALAEREETGAEAERMAACRYARRRRIGPWRAAGRAEFRERDLAALARQGFGYDLARNVIDAESPEALLDEIGGDA